MFAPAPPLILNIETATDRCSVALFEGTRCLSLRENEEPRSHSRLLTLLIGEVFSESGRTMEELSAVAVSGGPGSFTGLRIGVSAAKGICSAWDKPLICIPTLTGMASAMREKAKREDAWICPMIDARRMEVYTALYDAELNIIEETNAKIIEENSFDYIFEKRKLIFAGDGAVKANGLYGAQPNAVFVPDRLPSALHMGALSLHKFNGNAFEDTDSFEPVYGKDFMIGR